MTRSLGMQMLRGLKEEWLKRNLPRKAKEKGAPPPPSSQRSAAEEQGRKRFGAETKNATESVLLH